MSNLHTPERQPEETPRSRSYPACAPFFECVFPQPAQLTRAANKASPRRFSGASLTGFSDLDADAPDERLELERDMHDDMVRRSA